MRLIYKQFNNYQDFEISEDSKLTPEQSTHVLNEFKQYSDISERLEKFKQLQEQKKALEKELKLELHNLKETFKEFAIDTFPELVL